MYGQAVCMFEQKRIQQHATPNLFSIENQTEF